MDRRVLQILLREKSEIGKFDDESLHGLEITKGDYRGEGKAIKSSRRGIYKFLKAGFSDPS